MASQFIFSVLAPISMLLVMLGMGMSLTPDDFKRVVVYPRAVITGSILQMIALPLIGFGLAYLFGALPAVAVGLVLLTACPGGTASNMISHISKGDTALSITLTVISSFVTVITIPWIVNLALRVFMGAEAAQALPILETSIKVFIIVVPPVLLGMFIRYKFTRLAVKTEGFVKVFAFLVLMLLVVASALAEGDNMFNMFRQTGWLMTALLLVASGIGFLGARLAKINMAQSITITVEVGIQNCVLALVIATTFLKNSTIAFPAAVYAVIMLCTWAVVSLIINLATRERVATDMKLAATE